MYERIFVITICLLAIVVPPIKLGGIVDTINPLELLVWGMAFIYFVHKPKNVVDCKFDFLYLLFFSFFSILLVSGIGDENRRLYDSFIDPLWYKMYHTDIEFFFNTSTKSFFQLVNLLIFYVVYKIGAYFSLTKNFDLIIYRSLSVAIFFQFFVGVFQYVTGNLERPYGTLGNAQAFSSFALLAMIFISGVHVSKINKIISILPCVAIVILSGTRSSIFLLPIMFFILNLENKKLINTLLFSVFFANCILVILIPFVGYDELISLISIYTSSYTIYLRYMMWDGFISSISNNLLLGTYGIIPRFAENVIWYYLISYGVFGAGVYLYLFKNSARNTRSKLIILFSLVQGLTYYGFLVAQLGLLFWFILGYTSRKIEN